MSRKVYILGAGFSVSAGLPTQFDLTREIFNPQFSDANQEQHNFFDTQKKLLELLRSDFGINEESEYSLSLEDIYTPLDRCIIENSNFRSFHPEELLNLRQTLDAILILAIKAKSRLSEKSDYIEKFATHLIESSKTRINNYRRNDPVAVITTNWDILLDVALREKLSEEQGIIDYLCYVSSLRNDATIIPGLQALTQGKFIVKLLKIHGSINWLHCPKCQRIFIDFYRRVIDYGVFRQAKCKYCAVEYGDQEQHAPRLRPLLLMPTFVKDLSNFQTKLIWRNSGMEIAEADELIFIGYSFPHADFEFRQLLFRNVKRTAQIKVVLYDKDNPDKVITSKDKLKLSYESPEYRYLSFFGGKDTTIYFKGAEQFINEMK
jgi:NAD-dependent SIR2 family protein deacetylase